MVDEIFDRFYQEGRSGLNAGLDRGLSRIGNALSNSLKALHRIEWNAPWKASPKHTQCN